MTRNAAYYLAGLATMVVVACGGGGGDEAASPTQPTCIPRVVTVALQGDSTMYAIDGAADRTLPWDQIRSAHSPHIELQALMDVQFGKGMVVVSNYAVPGTIAEMAPRVVADVIGQITEIGALFGVALLIVLALAAPAVLT